MPGGAAAAGPLMAGPDREHCADNERHCNHLMASTSDFKNGLVLRLDGVLWTITEFQHVKPG